jgi:hypothetical protein
MENKTIEVYVTLFDEGTDTIRPTKAIHLGDGLYKLLATPWYDPEDETWEFLPESIVRIKKSADFHGNEVMLAYEQVKS